MPPESGGICGICPWVARSVKFLFSEIKRRLPAGGKYDVEVDPSFRALSGSVISSPLWILRFEPSLATSPTGGKYDVVVRELQAIVPPTPRRGS